MRSADKEGGTLRRLGPYKSAGRDEGGVSVQEGSQVRVLIGSCERAKGCCLTVQRVSSKCREVDR